MAITNGYATLAQLKDFIESDSSATAHDSDLERAVEAASRAIDDYCSGTRGAKRFFYDSGSVTARVFKASDPYELRVVDFHTITGLVIKTDTTDDGTYDNTWTTDEYQVEPLDPDSGWPWNRLVAIDTELFPTAGRRGRVQVTAQWGWAAVPKIVETTCLIVAKEIFQRKDAPFGFVSEGERVSATELPALERLDSYRRI